ncbi:uncharacterized protein SCHCODRAFT_02214351 [Schizophyllum commune H4-8]|nr:uncharacterized protein SCHCODRAFT_02214351 [Schizophyllum commune H4-8]KAI5894690.1 hypothetical protein SCHCODRAFT_02214351 [Schizophyllum commune H4-8]
MDAERQAHTLASEIDRLLSLAQELSAHLQRLSDFATQQRAIAAPVRRLPDELLEQIFRLACAGVVFSYPLSKPMLTAVTISHVCHRWRTIAEHDKQLWAPALIKLHEDDINALPKKPTVEQLRLFKAALLAYLTRSDPLPFAIDLRGSCTIREDHGSKEFSILPKMDFIDAVTRRCHHARFCRTSVRYFSLMLHFYMQKRDRAAGCVVSIMLEVLETFELVDDPRAWLRAGVSASYHLDFLKNYAPRLRFWKQDIIDLGHDFYDTAMQHVAAHTVVRLEASWTDSELAINALSSCASLKELIIGLCHTTDTWSNPNREVMMLPELESLTVAAVPVRSVLGRLLSGLTAPRLRHARFRRALPDEERRIDRELAPDRTDFPHVDFAGFLERSGCALESLALQGVCATLEDAVLLRERMSSMTELLIEDAKIA